MSYSDHSEDCECHNIRLWKLLDRFYTHDDNDNDKPCINIIKLINDAIDNNLKLDKRFIARFYQMVVNIQKRCMSHAHDDIIGLTIKLFKLQMIQGECLRFIIHRREFDHCYKHFTNVGHDCLKLIVMSRLRSTRNNEKDNVLIENIFPNLIFNERTICKLLKSTNVTVMELLLPKMETVTQKYLTKACTTLPYSKCVVSHLLKKNLKVTNDDILRVCKCYDSEPLMIMLEMLRFKIEKEHYNAVVSVQCSNQGDKVNMLLNGGYIPDIDDVIMGIKYRLEIPGIERYNLVIGKNVFYACCERRFFPDYVFVGVSQDTLKFAKAYSRARIGEMKKMVKHGFVLDKEFVQMLMKSNMGNHTFNELMMLQGNVNYECMKKRFEQTWPKQFPIIERYVNDLHDQLKKKDEELMRLNLSFDVYEFNDNMVITRVKKINHCVVKLLLDIDDVISFADFKRMMLNKIIEEQWINGTYIVIPKQHRNLFNLGGKYAVNVKDIDHLLCNCLK